MVIRDSTLQYYSKTMYSKTMSKSIFDFDMSAGQLRFRTN